KNGLYGFDLVPGFWRLLDEKAGDGILASPVMVYQELVSEVDDELAQWVRDRRNSGLFVEPDDPVQSAFRDIADYVETTYSSGQASAFLSGADPWLIAHAKVYGGKVVTYEKQVASSSTRAKIPNVCVVFEVESIRLLEMLRAMGASFG
ncbi:MAG: DUF4411 family protein, partial [Chloroflexi bacterium]|nr:DUF4411 family protein [Chloroflexota bacterium]